MQPELALRAITHGTIGIVIIAFLLVLLIGLRKELAVEAALRGTVYLGVFILGLCTFMALMTAYVQARRTTVPETFSHRLDTAFARAAGSDILDSNL